MLTESSHPYNHTRTPLLLADSCRIHPIIPIMIQAHKRKTGKAIKAQKILYYGTLMLNIFLDISCANNDATHSEVAKEDKSFII